MSIVSIHLLFFYSTRRSIIMSMFCFIDCFFVDRILPLSSTVSSINDQEQKSSVIPHHRHLFSHIIKAQRHSDPYSIKWITEGSHESDRTTTSIDTSILPSNMLRIALSSSSSKLSTSLIAIFLLLFLR
jgi:hypothetical protein